MCLGESSSGVVNEVKTARPPGPVITAEVWNLSVYVRVLLGMCVCVFVRVVLAMCVCTCAIVAKAGAGACVLPVCARTGLNDCAVLLLQAH